MSAHSDVTRASTTSTQSSTVVHIGFSTSTGMSDRKNVGKDGVMGEVRRSNNQCINASIAQQITMVAKLRIRMIAAHCLRDGVSCPRQRLVVGIAHCRHHGTGQSGDIANVLAAHHAGANDSDSDVCHREYSKQMHTPRTLGSQFTVGPLAFGCWRFTSSDVSRNVALIDAALDAGFTLVDNADVYGLDWGGTGFGSCEENLGAVLTRAPRLRDRMVLATKGGIMPGVPYDSSADYLVRAAEESLRRLNVDHVDLYQIHRPDFFAHPAEIASAFADLHHRGLVSEFGVSNFSAAQTTALSAHLDRPLVSVQPEFSAAHTAPLRDGTFDLCLERGLVPLAWSPLAGGRIATGDGIRRELIAVLDELAEVHRTSRVAVALAFVLHHPSRPVAIVGTQKVDRLRELASATSLSLSRTELYRIIEASEGVPLP